MLACLLPLTALHTNLVTSRSRGCICAALVLTAAAALATIRTIPIDGVTSSARPARLVGEVTEIRWDHHDNWVGVLKTADNTINFSTNSRPPFGAVEASGLLRWFGGKAYLTRMSTRYFPLPAQSESQISWLDQLRQHLRDRIDERLSPSEAGLARALVLGERDAISSDRYSHYRSLGVLHLLAVSGMHLWCLDAILRRLLAFLPSPFKWLRLIMLALAALAAGFRPAVVRALSVLCLRDFARSRGRDCPSGSLWALALWCECLLLPPRAGNFGLVLSYSATAGLLWVNRAHPAALQTAGDGLLPRPLRLIAKATYSSLAASLATAPWLHAIHGTIEPWSVVLTPILGLLLPLRLLASWMVCTPVFHWPASTLLESLGKFEGGLLNLLDGLPGTPLVVPELEWWRLTLVCWSVLLLLGCRRKLLRRALWVSALVFSHGLWRPPASRPGVAVIPVGHGLAVVIASAHRSLIFDFGSRIIPPQELVRRRLWPLLAKQRWRAPDLLVASHGDSDHLAGLRELAKDDDARFLAAPEGSHMPIHGLSPFALRLFNAPVSAQSGGNAGGQAIVVQWANHLLLITGDQEGPALRWLAAALPDTHQLSTTLIIPHHGLSTDGLPELLDICKPIRAFVSCSIKDFPLPAAAVLEKRGIPLFSTARDGVLSWP